MAMLLKNGFIMAQKPSFSVPNKKFKSLQWVLCKKGHKKHDPMEKILIFVFITTTLSAQNGMLCQGAYWTEDEANLVMKDFAGQWSDLASWEARAAVIKSGIITGLQLDKMPDIKGNFNPIIHNKKILDGYT